MDETKEEGEISDDEEEEHGLDDFAATDEFDDISYRDMLLEYYVAGHRGKEKETSNKLQAFYYKLKSTGQLFHSDERQHTDENITEEGQDYTDFLLKESAEDDLYELELRLNALASVPVDIDVRSPDITKPNLDDTVCILGSKDDESLRATSKVAGSSLSRRKEFCDFMQMMQPLDVEILKKLPSFDNKSMSPATGYRDIVSLQEDNYEEVEMDIGDGSSDTTDACSENALSDHSTIPKLIEVVIPTLCCDKDESNGCDAIASTSAPTPYVALPCAAMEVTEVPSIDGETLPVTAGIDLLERVDRVVEPSFMDTEALALSSDSTSIGQINSNVPIKTFTDVNETDEKLSCAEEDNLEEVEALLLRSELLRSLTTKNEKQLVESKVEPKVIQIPIHKPVVISLTDGETTSDSDSEVNPPVTSVCKPQKVSDSIADGLRGSLDSFLHAAREASKVKAATPEPIIEPGVKIVETTKESRLLKQQEIFLRQFLKDNKFKSRKSGHQNSLITVAKAPEESPTKHVNAKLMHQQKLDELKKKLELRISVQRKQLETLENDKVCQQIKMNQMKALLKSTEIRIKQLQEQLVIAQQARTLDLKEISTLSAESFGTQKIAIMYRKRLRNLENQLLCVRRQLAYSDDDALRPAVYKNSSKTADGTSSVAKFNITSPAAKVNMKKSLDSTAMRSHNFIPASVQPSLFTERTGDHVTSSSSTGAVDVDSRTVLKRLVDGKATTGLAFDKMLDGTAVNSVAIRNTVESKGNTFADRVLKVPREKRLVQLTQIYKRNILKFDVAQWIPCHHTFLSSDPVLSFQFPVVKFSPDKVVSEKFMSVKSVQDERCSAPRMKPYKSGLLRFKAYRFSPYFSSKGALSLKSATYSNNLDCHTPICQFELMGKCLDDQCSWQHQSDYSMDTQELLTDIVSYHPSLAGVTANTPVDDYPTVIGDYVGNLLKKHGTSVSDSNLCSLLLDKVLIAANRSSSDVIFTEPRQWKPAGLRAAGISIECATSESRSVVPVSHEQVVSDQNGATKQFIDEDNLANDETRYWSQPDSDSLYGVSAADGLSNLDAWLRIVSKKMNAMKRNESSYKSFLDHCLNVLSRAVEGNKSNSLLWQRYLTMYALRLDAHSDLLSLYVQAVQHAPSYELYWKILQLTCGYSAKVEVCKKIRQFLCSPRCVCDERVRSHRLAEVVLFQAALSVISGHAKAGLQVLQAVVKSKVSVVWLTLTAADRVLMWLSFIHLFEFFKLPTCLYDPSDSNPGVIVKKTPFVLPWPVGGKTRISCLVLVRLLDEAVVMCEASSGATDDADLVSWISALRRSRIVLELAHDRWKVAEELCRTALRDNHRLVDIWILLLQLLVRRCNTDDGSDASQEISLVLEEGLKQNPCCLKLFLAAISVNILLGDTDCALDYAERCPISQFDVPSSDTSVDPNLLYCKLLNQPVPLTYRFPNLHPDVAQSSLDHVKADLWLGYCLLLDLQGAHSQATETYHTAISCLSTASDTCRLWSMYLQRRLNVMCGRLLWSAETTRVVSKDKLWNEFVASVNSALHSLPVKSRRPFADEFSEYWSDYSSHNEIVSLYLSSCLSDQAVYQKLLHMMPANVELVLRVCGALTSVEDGTACFGYTMMALQECVTSFPLWKVYDSFFAFLYLLYTRASVFPACNCGSNCCNESITGCCYTREPG